MTRYVALGVVVLLGAPLLPAREDVHAHAAHARGADGGGDSLTARKSQLEERLSEIQRGATLVRGARRLGLVKPGEHLFIVQGIAEWRRAHSHR